MTARTRVLGLFTALGLIALGQIVTAEDWPAWRGPARDGQSKETGLLKEWPKDGPKLLWKAKGIGGGYSSPSLAGGKIYILGTKGGSVEHIFCLDTANEGKILWSTEIGKTAGGSPGPRCTPTVADGRVYALSSNGWLVCASADKGEIKWKKNLESDYGGRKGGWAYSESPLIDGDTLVCTPGGSKATLLALKSKSGDEIWKAPVTGLKGKDSKKGRKSEYNTAGYSSVIVAEVGGVKQYIQFLAGGVVGISAKDGKLLWNYNEPANGTANCSTPLFKDGAVFAASGYGTGGGKVELKEDNGSFKAEQKFFVRSLQNHHGNMVLVDDHIYGTGSSSLICASFKDGKVAWDKRGVGKGSVAYADGHIYHRGENGDMALVEATPKDYVEKGRFRQPDRSSQRAWASPVVADGKLYLRDWDTILCYDIKAK
jgi:outer membrane protein assembly factor BamB